MLEQLIAGETSVKNLSEKLGLSERQVRYALKKLEEERRISYTFLLDYYFYPFEFIILFKQRKLRSEFMHLKGKIVDFNLSKLKFKIAIEGFYFGLGAYQALMHGYANSKDELREFMNSFYDNNEFKVFFIENATIKNFMPTKPCAELTKLKNVHNILYEIIKNSRMSVKEIASKVKLKEHQVRYIIKKLRKSNMGRYYIKVNMEELYPIEFLLVSPEIIKLPEEVLVKNLFLTSNKALLHGFTKDIKNLYELVKRFSTGETIIIVEKLIENFLFMEEYV
ncbi:MAG: hypothetical protein DRN88_01645 [Candidatus Hydrothermarchaeota archaeon]|nr:MAG: hypothetical protein DRN88_01645 [Candidatus Hydrothermarchaeota archaeon]